jgi:UDP-N-acetylglucosamine--N-acetylmuramyl-(pentapeptide) pyrophosphoryl-undecaprenol N-acetylglucosamine transferase
LQLNNQSGNEFKLVLTGGGTAGHVWPHFALVDDPNSSLGKLAAQGQLKVFYLGSVSGMEREIVENSGKNWTYKGIQTGKLRRYFSLQNFSDPFRIILGFFQAFFFLYRIKAHVVFSKGGFVSAPVVWAAWLNRIPVVIHESDATPALATMLTLPFAQKALIAFAETAKKLPPRFRNKIIHIGLPIRKSLFIESRAKAIAHFGLAHDKKTLLVFGGSLGALELNKRIAKAVPILAQKYNIIHIVGKGKSIELNAGPHYKQFEFLSDEMSLVYACSDAAICRAGASSIFELAAARIPMILVPLGLHQSRGDQIINARLFEERGWAVSTKEEDFTEERIIALTEEIFAALPERKNALLSAPSFDCAQKVGELLLSLRTK